MAASRRDLFHTDLETAFLQGQSYDVNRDVVCQVPPEAGRPPLIAATLKKPACGMNDAPRRWWNIHDEALHGYGMVPTRAGRCCLLLYSLQSRKQAWKHWIQGTFAQQNGIKEAVTDSRDKSEMEATCGKRRILLLEVQLSENPWQESIFLWMVFWEQVEKTWYNVF